MRLIAFGGVLYVIFGVVMSLMAVSRYFFDLIPTGARWTRTELFWLRILCAWGWWFMFLSPVGRTGIYLLLHSHPEDLTGLKGGRNKKAPK